jgi:hypothetical protein
MLVSIDERRGGLKNDEAVKVLKKRPFSRQFSGEKYKNKIAHIRITE